MSASRFVYVIHIRTTPEKLWAALTQPEFTKRYWCETWQESDWKPGASWRAMIPDGRVADSGEVKVYDPPKKLVLTWENQFIPDMKAEGPSVLTYEITPTDGAVKLVLTHEMDRPEFEADRRSLQRLAATHLKPQNSSGNRGAVA